MLWQHFTSRCQFLNWEGIETGERSPNPQPPVPSPSCLSLISWDSKSQTVLAPSCWEEQCDLSYGGKWRSEKNWCVQRRETSGWWRRNWGSLEQLRGWSADFWRPVWVRLHSPGVSKGSQMGWTAWNHRESSFIQYPTEPWVLCILCFQHPI